MEIRGRYVLRDKDNNIVLDKDNMIVLDGRKFVAVMLAKSIKSGDEGKYEDIYANKEVPDTISEGVYIFLGRDGSATRVDHIVDTKSGRFIEVKNDNIEAEVSSKPRIKFTVTVSSDSSEQPVYNEVGLFLDGHFFSRIAVDPIHITADTTFYLDYYLYF